jgi:hypothetical protein
MELAGALVVLKGGERSGGLWRCILRRKVESRTGEIKEEGARNSNYLTLSG